MAGILQGNAANGIRPCTPNDLRTRRFKGAILQSDAHFLVTTYTSPERAISSISAMHLASNSEAWIVCMIFLLRQVVISVTRVSNMVNRKLAPAQARFRQVYLLLKQCAEILSFAHARNPPARKYLK